MPLLRCPDDALAAVLAFAGHHAAPLRAACRRLAGLRAGHGRGVALVYLRREHRAFDAAARLPSHPVPPGTGTLVLLVRETAAVRLVGARDATAEARAALEQAARRYPDAGLLVYAYSYELSAAVAALWPRASVLTSHDGWDVRAPYSRWSRCMLSTVTPRCSRVQYDRASERCIADAVCGMPAGCAVWLRDRETAPAPHTELFCALARQAVRIDTHLARLDWGAVVPPTGPPLHLCVLVDEQRGGGRVAYDLPLPPRSLPRVVSMELVDVLPADAAGFAAAFPCLRFIRFVASAGSCCAPITGSEAERLTALLRLPQLREYDTDAQTLPRDRLLCVGVARRDAGCVPLAVHRTMVRRGTCVCGPVPLALTGHEPGLCPRDDGWAERYGMLGTGLTAQM